MDGSIDAHAEEIDMYGDGSAVGSPVPPAAPAAPAEAAPVTGGMAGSAATLAGSCGGWLCGVGRMRVCKSMWGVGRRGLRPRLQ
jgi:hypothetical protein